MTDYVIFTVPLELTLHYRPIRDEFLNVVNAALLSILQSASLLDALPWFTINIISAVEASTNLHWYAMSGSLDHVKFIESDWSKLVEENFPTRVERTKIVQTLGDIYEALGSVSQRDVPDDWRILTIPIELPLLNVRHFSSVDSTSISYNFVIEIDELMTTTDSQCRSVIDYF